MLQIKNVEIKKLNPAAYNPREINDSAFEGLKESLKKFGMPQPIILNTRTNTMVGGHQRLKAASALGWETVPVVEVDLTLAEEKALNVTLNNQKISGHFTEGLGELLQEIRVELGDEFMASIKLDVIEVPPLNFSSENTSETKTGARELSADSFSEFNTKCPRCGFEFDVKKD